ncbi:unnamed protein product [Toxocara canis]|uniref:ANK_REP_REGION domain-containing protein n=1 Tax=Toxocara canis TaxID=6265 RepID=A0A183UV06_TOXCA|nr:unnamed protein product [Toxocara canis]
MEIDDETNEMGASNDSSEFNAEMLSLPATSSSSSLTTLDESSCSSDENITHACKCATFVRQPNLADNVFYRCLAQDMRYGIYYPCSQRAQLMHATMFHDHRQCQHCRTFCYQGNFMVCTEGDVDHWMDRACFRTMNRRCAHCDSLGPHIERWNFHPERSAVFNKLADMLFEYNTGKQLNLLSLCDEDSERWLLEVLDSVLSQSAESAKSSGLCDSIANGDHRALLRTLLVNVFPENEDSNDDLHKAINECLRHDDNLALLILLQFVDIRPNFENLALAINRGNVRAVNVLLYHGAPLHANNSGMEMDNLLNYALDLHKLNVADEILKCASAYEGFIDRRHIDTLVCDAVSAGDIDRLRLVMQHSANICAKDEGGESVLHRLARCHDKNAVQVSGLR